MTTSLRNLSGALLLVGALLTTATVAARADEAKPLGITNFTMQTTREVPVSAGPNGGMPFVNEPYSFTQAGGHPYALTTTVSFTGEEVEKYKTLELTPTRDPKDIVVGLPPGLLGDPMAVPRCPLRQATVVGNVSDRCPGSTQIGVFELKLFGGKTSAGPIVNVTPEAGQSAEFGLEVQGGLTVLLTAHLVRSPNGYGFTVISNGIAMTELSNVKTTFWGVPADPSHDRWRGLFCTQTAREGPIECEGGGEHAGVAPVPFITMPTGCSAGPELATVRADSWEEPGHVGVNGKYENYAEAQTSLPGATGCDLLQFNAGTGIGIEPDTQLADEPVALGVKLHIPLTESPGANATPQLRDTVVSLPEGMSVSSGVVDGIQACNAFGPEGINITGPESEEVGLNGELQLAPGHCPDASTVGTAEAITPFLPTPVRGHVYLARPGCGGPTQKPCSDMDALDGNLFKLYLELGGTGEFANTGIEFKVPGYTEANPATGQLTTRFEDLVQAPYSEVRIHLNGGPRAPIDNPAGCGPATTTADFKPWSAPGWTPATSESKSVFMPGTPDANVSSFFNVTGCSHPSPFNPGFVAGTVTPNAGKFSAFTLNLSRKDREQYIKGIQVHTPPGLLAMLSSVPMCPDSQANDPAVYGECPPSSKIGTTRVATGAGSHPFEIDGNIFLTGPHGGAPFGLSIVTHAVAGPFNLGLVVVRARIDIDRDDSTAIVTTDESGPYALPQIIFGVPLRLQRVTVNIDRPGFMFNPTSCAVRRVTAMISGSQESVASVSSPFAVGNCTSLTFKPRFVVSTSGKTSRAKGASLDARLSYPPGSMGLAANIARVKVSLPKQLPSYLPTLQKACLAATFEADPAACPAGSVVGVAKASTPLLPVGLAGPVYFVSHGGEEFPSLIIVLQGDGVRVDLTGSTFISKGITSSTFKTVPDVPVDSFELYLPQGKDHALAANGDLCRQRSKLVMPTEFVAQNGAASHRRIKLRVAGCAVRTAAALRARRAVFDRAGRASRTYTHSHTSSTRRFGR